MKVTGEKFAGFKTRAILAICKSYKYRVIESFVAKPNDSWVMGEVRDRDLLTLQTCTGPDYSQRLRVRADRSQTAGL